MNAYEFPKPDLERLVALLIAQGRRVVAPTPGDDAIVYDRIRSAADLPVGWIDEQEAGTYRARPTDSGRYFDYTVGPHSYKKFLFPPRLPLARVRKVEGTLRSEPPEDEPPPRYAFFGVRACESAAIAIQDRVFLEGPYVDKTYAARRRDVFVVAVDCSRAGKTCFCASMNAGPRNESGFDLALLELDDRFVARVGSEAGRAVAAELGYAPASPASLEAGERVVAATRASMGRAIDTDSLPETLLRNLDHPRYDDVASRCLSCANCTMVCPTCFCSGVEEVNELRADVSTRVRVWDSCFSIDFSHVSGGALRPTVRDRYRQWFTHKLATWVEQFGTFGCVGCGRCISWCPPGIDLTAEVAAIRASDGKTGPR